ncbi:MAG: FAD-binding oxidoreductase [Flavobacteriales bacterium]|nr:FAD-binding oxidoreductase [Flavobacteriales bacterium]
MEGLHKEVAGKFGLTCDSVEAIEIILADGSINKVTKRKSPDLFWALKGGGGGNFGVVTRFKFKLAILSKRVTSFSFLWKDEVALKKVLNLWMNLHAGTSLPNNLSSFCAIRMEKPEGKGQNSAVHLRMGGKFYGSKDVVINILLDNFGLIVPDESSFTEVAYHKEQKCIINIENDEPISMTKIDSLLADFLNPTTPHATEVHDIDRSNYLVLPAAPTVTCDRPHPHKISSNFPKKFKPKDNAKLINDIYKYLSKSIYYSDVNRYMSFHSLGGAVKDNPDSRVFNQADKPYLLQMQCW